MMRRAPRTGLHLLAVAFVLLVGLGMAAPVGANPSALRNELNRSEQKRLEAGKIVIRRTAEQRGNLKLVGGTSWQVIDRPPKEVWRALHDTGRFRRMLPEVAEVRVVEKKNGVITMKIRHSAPGPDPYYFVNIRYAKDRRDVFFQVDPKRPGSLRVAWGFLRLESWRGGKTLASWGVMADVGTGFIAGLVRPTVHEWILKVPFTIKRFLEGAGRSLYMGS